MITKSPREWAPPKIFFLIFGNNYQNIYRVFPEFGKQRIFIQ